MPTKSLLRPCVTRSRQGEAISMFAPEKQKAEGLSIVCAIEKIHGDLKKFIKILKNETTPSSVKRRLYPQFLDLLCAHASSQEKVVVFLEDSFPELDLIKTSSKSLLKQHNAKEFAKKIAVKPIHTEIDSWLSQIRTLAEMVERHIMEEENGVLCNLKKELEASTSQRFSGLNHTGSKIIPLRKQMHSQIGSRIVQL